VITTALIEHLKQRSDVTALAGDRVYPLAAPQGAGFPRVLLTRIDGGHDSDLDGPSGWSQPLILVQCQAERYAQARDLGQAVFGALGGLRGWVGSVRVTGSSCVGDSESAEPQESGKGTAYYERALTFLVSYDEPIPDPN